MIAVISLIVDMESDNMFRAKVITVSDKGYKGERVDESGPLVRNLLTEAGYEVLEVVIVPDEMEMIMDEIKRASNDDIALIVTTGGTGFSPRDITPEATTKVCERMVPGIAEAMRAASMAITNRAMLSRGVSGIRDRSLIINLPGSKKAASENLLAVLPALEHGLTVLREKPMDCGRDS